MPIYFNQVNAFGVSTGGNTGGDTGARNGTWVIVASTNITASQSTGTNGVHSVYLSAASGGTGGGGNFSAGVSTGGNTAGATGVTGSRIVFVASQGLQLSQTTDANGATISILPSGTLSQFVPFNWQTSTAIANANSSLRLIPINIPAFYSGTQANVAHSVSVVTATNSTVTYTYTLGLALYSLNGVSWSLASSGSQSYNISMTNGGSTASFAGPRMLSVPITLNASPGNYLMGVYARSSGANATVSELVQMMTSPMSGSWNQASNSTHQFMPGLGFYSSNITGALPSAIQHSEIRGGAAAGHPRIPLLAFLNQTY